MTTKLYVVYLILLFTSILGGIILWDYINQLQTQSFQVFPYVFYKACLFIPTGIVLSLPVFNHNRMKAGNWTFNYIRFIILGVLSLFFMFYPFIHFSFISLPTFIAVPIFNTSTYPIFSIIFGFAILSNFDKK
ncbi:hypothetical protein [Bacillus massiliigorillae]|uniref:hypothetical protein n=1 Tax=Bacillus massiliigorillae TaxID=1243664 RepID=UPI0005AA85B9|nr:hypothetical protein [Bacillus massiliigorillae]